MTELCFSPLIKLDGRTGQRAPKNNFDCARQNLRLGSPNQEKTVNEKQLSKSAWEAQAKKHKLDEKALSKALGSYEKCDEKDHAAQEEALKGVEKAAETLKKDKAYKEVSAYLGEVLDACGKARKALAEDEEEEGGEGEDEEAAYAKDLAKQLKSALSQVKGRAPDEPGATPDDGPKQLKFLAYVAAGKAAVIVAKTVGSGARKLAASIAGVSGGKYLQGDCIFEKNAHTFVLEQPPAGLARSLSAALLEETGQKFKVRVRTPDGSTESDDEADAQGETDPNAAKWAAVHAEMEPLLLAVLAAGRGDVSRIRAAWQIAQEKAEAGDFAAALLIAARLQPLLKEADAGGGPSEARKSIPADVVPFVQARLSWINARAKLLEEMKKLGSFDRCRLRRRRGIWLLRGVRFEPFGSPRRPRCEAPRSSLWKRWSRRRTAKRARRSKPRPRRTSAAMPPSSKDPFFCRCGHEEWLHRRRRHFYRPRHPRSHSRGPEVARQLALEIKSMSKKTPLTEEQKNVSQDLPVWKEYRSKEDPDGRVQGDYLSRKVKAQAAIDVLPPEKQERQLLEAQMKAADTKADNGNFKGAYADLKSVKKSILPAEPPTASNPRSHPTPSRRTSTRSAIG